MSPVEGSDTLSGRLPGCKGEPLSKSCGAVGWGPIGHSESSQPATPLKVIERQPAAHPTSRRWQGLAESDLHGVGLFESADGRGAGCCLLIEPLDDGRCQMATSRRAGFPNGL